MKWKNKTAMLLLLSLCFATQPLFAFQNSLPMQALDWLKELLRTEQVGNEMVVAIWIPSQIIRSVAMASGADAQVTTMEATDAFIESVRPYVVLVVADLARPSPGSRPEDAAAIHDSIRLKDREGTLYEPVDERKLPPMLKLLMSSLEVGLSQTKAIPGSGIEIIVFPGKNRKGSDIADPLKDGSFSLELHGAKLAWNLPITSLLPLKPCPVDGAMLNGAWKYCPFHGVELK